MRRTQTLDRAHFFKGGRARSRRASPASVAVVVRGEPTERPCIEAHGGIRSDSVMLTSPEGGPRPMNSIHQENSRAWDRVVRSSRSMQQLRVLCLALLALGIPVPGGLTIKACFCRGVSEVFHTHAGHGASKACCDAREDAAATGMDLRRSTETTFSNPSCDRDCRGCLELTTPEHEPSNAPPVQTSVCFLPPPVSFITWPASTRAESLPRLKERAHDPPGTRTNLPLRI